MTDADSPAGARDMATLKCFLQLVRTSKTMAQDVVPQLLSDLNLDKDAVQELAESCEKACASLNALVGCCKISYRSKLKPPAESRFRRVDSKAPVYKAEIFKGLTIKDDYVKLMAQIRKHLDDGESFFIFHCKPCEVSSFSKDSWANHTNTKLHVMKMNRKQYDNVLCSCCRCPFAIISSRRVAVTYMQFHVEKCHDILTNAVAVDECMRLKSISKRDDDFQSGHKKPKALLSSPHPQLCKFGLTENKLAARSLKTSDASSKPVSPWSSLRNFSQLSLNSSGSSESLARLEEIDSWPI